MLFPDEALGLWGEGSAALITDSPCLELSRELAARPLLVTTYSFLRPLCTSPLTLGYIVLVHFLMTIGDLADKEGALRQPPVTGKESLGCHDMCSIGR